MAPPAAPTVAPVAAPMAAFGSSVQAQHEPRRGRAVPFVSRILHSSTVRERSSTFGPSLLASRGDPDRRLPAWVPPCSRSVQERRARIAPRFPRPPPAEGPRRFRQCRSGPARAARRKQEGRTANQWDVPFDAGEKPDLHFLEVTMQALLGTRLAADVNLAAQIVLLVGLWIGFYFARTGQVTRHASMQTTMVMANLFFILFVMVPSFYQYVILGGTTGGIVARLMLIHGLLGLVAQLMGVYLVLRMRTKLIPARFRVRNFISMMWWTLGLWTVIFVLGIGIYYYRYLVPKPVTTVTASLERFRQAGGDLVNQAGELRMAAERRDAQAARRAAERLVNLIEGKTGTTYGDLDKSGSVEDPGDGIGLLNYLRALTNAAPEGPVASLSGTGGGGGLRRSAPTPSP